MATETSVTIQKWFENEHVEIVASTAKKAMDELDKITFKEQSAKTGSDSPDPATEAPAEQESAPEPEFTLDGHVRPAFEALQEAGGRQESLDIVTQLGAIDPDTKHPKIVALDPDKFAEAIKLANEATEKLKASQGTGVL